MDSDKPKIAIIDDDEDIVEVTKAFLNRKGFHILSAYDAETGLPMIRSENPDLVLLDVMLPGMDGYELCRIIKEDTVLWHIPVIYFTAKGDFRDKISGLKSGADDYITKPFDPEELLARITTLLERTSDVLDANPLSRLPGNNAIQKQIVLRLENRKPVAVAYLDIDHFKSFNDEYGFERGDQAILGLAQILKEIVKASGKAADFLGHVGGDDFVMISDPAGIDDLCTDVIRRFDALARSLYDPADRRRGYLILKDRRGHLQEFPLMSLSIAVITNEQRPLTHIGQVISLAAELKKYAKTLPGSNYVKDRRSGRLCARPSAGVIIEEASGTASWDLDIVLDPVHDVRLNTPAGYEVSIRNRSGSPDNTHAREFFEAVIDARREQETAKAYFEKMSGVAANTAGTLWISSWIHPKVLLAFLEQKPSRDRRPGLNLAKIVCQIKTEDCMRYEKLIRGIISLLKAEKSGVALLMDWDSPLPLAMFADIKPEFVFLSPDFIARVQEVSGRAVALKMLAGMRRHLDFSLVAQGVKTPEHARMLSDFGIFLVSGTTLR